MEIWVGKNYQTSKNKILVLGESWYGQEVSIAEYISKWAAREIKDTTFSRIFNAGSGSHTSKATESELLDFWHTIVFYNYVVGTVGETRSHRPTKMQYEFSESSLNLILKQFAPDGVWVLGKEQSHYSVPVIESLCLPYEVVAHPTSFGLKAKVLQNSWRTILEKTA